MHGEGIEEPFFIEASGDIEIGTLPGHCVEVAESFAHAAVLGAEDALHVLEAEGLGVEIDPRGHLLHEIESLLVAAVNVHVEQSGHNFVNGVERRPDFLALTEPVEELYREGTEIAALQSVLALAEA